MHELLERRRHWTTVSITAETCSVEGTIGDDSILITYSTKDFLVRVYDHGVLRGEGGGFFLKHIVVMGNGGNDLIEIDASIPSSVTSRLFATPADHAPLLGNATLIGGSGNDILVSGPGRSVLEGRDGDDSLYEDGGTMHGGNGNDWLYSDGGDNEIFGDAGFDAASYIDSESPVTVDISDEPGETADDGAAGEHDFVHTDIEHLVGSRYDDYLAGSNNADDVEGNEGNDTLYGFDGNDILVGDDGDDSIVGNANKDSLYGGTGNDTMRGYGGKDYLDGQDGIDKLYGGDGNDRLIGGSSNDRIQGDAGDDYMIGAKGNDHFYAKADGGRDTLWGSDGSDDARVDPDDLVHEIEIRG